MKAGTESRRVAALLSSCRAILERRESNPRVALAPAEKEDIAALISEAERWSTDRKKFEMEVKRWRQLSARYPDEISWMKLVQDKEFAVLVENSNHKRRTSRRSNKQEKSKFYERNRKRRTRGVSSLERQFAAVSPDIVSARHEFSLVATWTGAEQPSGPVARFSVDGLLQGEQVRMTSLVALFDLDRKNLRGFLPAVGKGPGITYGIAEFLTLAEGLIKQGKWLKDEKTRNVVMTSLQIRAETIAPPTIRAAVQRFVQRQTG